MKLFEEPRNSATLRASTLFRARKLIIRFSQRRRLPESSLMTTRNWNRSIAANRFFSLMYTSRYCVSTPDNCQNIKLRAHRSSTNHISRHRFPNHPREKRRRAEDRLPPHSRSIRQAYDAASTGSGPFDLALFLSQTIHPTDAASNGMPISGR